MMKSKGFFSHLANFPKIRLSARVWKVQIKLPWGFCLKGNVVGVETVKLAIFQILN